jgi:hypothetical protein
MQKSIHKMRDFTSSMQIHIYINELCLNNQEHFWTNLAIYSVNIRNRDHPHRPIANVSCFQKSALYYAGIKILNSLPSNLRSIMNKKAKFKVILKKYLNTPTLLRNY